MALSSRLSPKRYALAALACTAATIAWGMLFWGLVSPAIGMFRALPNADVVTRELTQAGLETGTYFVPWPRDRPEAAVSFVEHHRRGGFYALRFVREGVDPDSPAKLALGTLQYALAAAIAVALTAAAGSYRARAARVLAAGMMGTIFITLADPIWFHMPWHHSLGRVLYETVAWLLLASIAAAIARPAT